MRVEPALSEEGIRANRAAVKWTRKELMVRALWELLRGPLFAWTPRPMWFWRRAILRLFGAQVGAKAHIFPSARIAVPWNVEIGDYSSVGDRAVIYSLGKIRIGKAVTISQHAHLCAGSHDYTQRDFPLLKMPIVVGDGAWVCADAYLGPGVSIGEAAVVAARAVVVRDVPARAIVGGNPARRIGMRPVP